MNTVTFSLHTTSTGREELIPVCETAFKFTNLIKYSGLDHGHMHWISELGYTVNILPDDKYAKDY